MIRSLFNPSRKHVAPISIVQSPETEDDANAFRKRIIDEREKTQEAVNRLEQTVREMLSDYDDLNRR